MAGRRLSAIFIIIARFFHLSIHIFNALAFANDSCICYFISYLVRKSRQRAFNGWEYPTLWRRCISHRRSALRQ